jgi:hypothetical protein
LARIADALTFRGNNDQFYHERIYKSTSSRKKVRLHGVWQVNDLQTPLIIPEVKYARPNQASKEGNMAAGGTQSLQEDSYQMLNLLFKIFDKNI